MSQPAKGPIPSTLPNMVMSLTIICSISAVLLGGAFILTRPQIEQRQVDKQELAIREVLPAFDNQVLDSAIWLDKDGRVLEHNGSNGALVLTRIFPATRQGQPVGSAVLSYSDSGYAKRIVTMTGFLPDGRIQAVQVMEQGETPGLGSKISTPAFLDQFSGRDPTKDRIKVRKDGGDIDAISAATISSRAVCEAVRRSQLAIQGKLP